MEVLLRLQNNNASSYGGDEEGSDVISLTKLTAEMEEYDSDVNSLTRCWRRGFQAKGKDWK